MSLTQENLTREAALQTGIGVVWCGPSSNLYQVIDRRLPDQAYVRFDGQAAVVDYRRLSQSLPWLEAMTLAEMLVLEAVRDPQAAKAHRDDLAAVDGAYD
jgi:hypothetical protein